VVSGASTSATSILGHLLLLVLVPLAVGLLARCRRRRSPRSWPSC
jgi:ACR3 family arsenite efflux pump ArsB